MLIVFSLLSDYFRFGFRPETMHKIFHVGLGVIVLGYGWMGERWWKIFPLANGSFFTFVAIFGCLFPDFGGLDAFNKADTILHSIVGITGLAVGFLDRVVSREKT
ncbi:hypothetical protein A3C91_00595 [Candidatus Azambacteria bacterium RIFCSPHIGHO2_02_FULL_52_12]|uniref:DUF4383 domain-containing protein n=1 Tax=Candidatus Azambacteria bacterium RIFCSPLOWO2_01_FULL_46_25 TaxID=1797298 RepID=A0A1F5BTP1_9BACT|nr:MAG: hypothetical protein A3C91_00595 [Candidatus Azambacteria bacterium RIFCSPHIGHO2_02_FULL_52_12]OGD33950.1 MAG: hypothetical protein A2988_00455 [Candidatus Azambacteria bacterium RIFCSPLOWO2_01_FULL_46_25]OGD37636.1 MAG: hypothetical protein A2850_04530 [Candidatus Azambacteria bacterium RIFCSPHIGHO2_01_FULL_51_74]